METKKMTSWSLPSLNTGQGSADLDKDYRRLYEKEFSRRTALMKLAQKATRDYDELKLRFCDSKKMVETLQLQLEEKEQDLENLRNTSESLFTEYNEMKTKYDVEIEKMAQALQRATDWYNENKSLRRQATTLKRQSALLLQKMSPSPNEEGFTWGDYSSTPEDAEAYAHYETQINSLNKIIQDLEEKVAELTSSLNSSRDEEFEAQEELMELRKGIDTLGEERDDLKTRVRELEEMEHRLNKASSLVVKEIEALEQRLHSEVYRANTAVSQASKAKRQHAALARQSTVILNEACSDERLKKALDEVYELTSKLISEQEQHEKVVKDLEDKLERQEKLQAEEEVEMLREKNGILDDEIYICRTEIKRANMKVEKLMQEVEFLNEELESEREKNTSSSVDKPDSSDINEPSDPPPSSIPPPPPPPPPAPIPPPPPAPPSSDGVTSLITIVGSSRKNKQDNVESSSQENNKQGGMDDLISQIKRGGIQLKQTRGLSLGRNTTRSGNVDPPEVPDKPSNAVQEMKNILASISRSKSGKIKPSAVVQKSKKSTITNPTSSGIPECNENSLTSEDPDCSNQNISVMNDEEPNNIESFPDTENEEFNKSLFDNEEQGLENGVSGESSEDESSDGENDQSFKRSEILHRFRNNSEDEQDDSDNRSRRRQVVSSAHIYINANGN